MLQNHIKTNIPVPHPTETSTVLIKTVGSYPHGNSYAKPLITILEQMEKENPGERHPGNTTVSL